MDLQSLENIKILVPENYMDVEHLHFVTQNWQTLFGFYIGIEEVPEEDYYHRLKTGDYVMALYPLSLCILTRARGCDISTPLRIRSR